jgi:hypothetical protein
MWLVRRVRISPGTPPPSPPQPRKIQEQGSNGAVFPSTEAGDTSAAAGDTSAAAGDTSAAAAGVSTRHHGRILYQYCRQ